MADLNLAFEADNGIVIDDVVAITYGDTNPAVAGQEAPIGSLYLRTTGELYQKNGGTDFDWVIFTQGSDQLVRISATDSTSGYLSTKLTTSSSLTSAVQNAGSNETFLLDLANVGTPGTYFRVTTNNKGQVTSGLNPTTLSGFGIVDAQPLDADLTALAALTTTGVLIRTGAGTVATRTLQGTSGQVVVTNGSGVSTDPTISLPSSGLTFPGTSGVFMPAGTTAQRVATPGAFRYNTDTATEEYYNGTAWVSLVASTGGTVTSVDATAPGEGLTITGQPITTSGTLVFSLANDLAALEALSTTGLSARTGTDTWSLRTIQGVTDRTTITDGNGVAGNPTIDIAATYLGQASITTLGIITTGTWAGTTIGTAFGGTGRTTIGSANQVLAVNTTATGLEYKTVQVSGAGLSITPGAGVITLTNTGVTSITGTANQVIASVSTGPITLSLPQSIGTGSSPTFAQVTVAANPTSALQVATKQYVDAISEGVDHKASVRAATTANITLSGEQTIDGVSLITGDRVLVKNQTTPAQNGIYIVDTGAWTRALDMDAWSEVPGAFTFVEEGTLNSDQAWISTADQGGTLGTTAITWVLYSSATVLSAGTGLQRIGNVFSIANIIAAGGPYNQITVNAQGQVVTTSNLAYLLANQTITLTGDVTGSGTTSIAATLTPTGIAAGTYTKVTVGIDGRVYSATSPTTLAGYGITDAQPLDADLTELAAFTGTGFAVRVGTDDWEQRSITIGSSKLSLTNGDGVAGNPVLDVVEANLSLNNIGGTLSPSKGGTGLTSLGAANQVFGINAAGTAGEYKTITSTGLTITHTPNGIDLSTINNGTVTSIAVTTTSLGLTIGGSPITSSGTITLTLNNELQSLSQQSGIGLVTRTGAASYAERSVVSGAGTLAITNPAGTAGNISIDLVNIGTSGSYYQVTTDNFGRVLSGTTSVPWSVITSTPTTLAGYGITDAQPLNSFLTSVGSNVNTGIVVKNGATSIIRSIVAGSARVSVLNGSGVAGNPTIDIGILNLGDLTNVVLTSPAVGDSLTFNGTNWVNSNISPKLYAENPVAQVTPVATGSNAIALGSAATAGAHDSVAIGVQSLSRHPGITLANGRFASQGDAQAATYILRTGTINGSPAEMFFDGTNGSERLVMATDSTWTFKITVVAHRTDASDHAGFKIDGVVYCGGSLNSIALLGNPTKNILSRSQSSWNVAVTADTVNGSLKITVTGAAGQSIRWTAIVETVEVTN